jgi:hypothetical protein
MLPGIGLAIFQKNLIELFRVELTEAVLTEIDDNEVATA